VATQRAGRPTSRTSTATRAQPDIAFWWAKATEVGLVPDPTAQPTFLQWQADGARLLRLDRKLPWLIGDWIKYGERRWGETYAQAMDETDYSYSRLSTFAYVCRQVEFHRRRQELTFGHHEVVAPLEPKLQDTWLARAIAKKWSIEDLRQALAGKALRDSGAEYWLERIIGTIDRAEREIGSIRLQEYGVGPVLRVVRRRLGRTLDKVKPSSGRES